MCGITGILNLSNKNSISKIQIQNMTASLSHRGPDGEDFFLTNEIALGHRRLSIIDLSISSHQPMHSPCLRYTITYNGELYNFKELRSKLEILNHVFRSQGDTEVILHAFMEWKEDCVKKLNGMFAFAIWDKKEKKLFLARDRYGIKPLYYAHNKLHNFIFASEIKAIIASGCYQSKIDKEALVEYLTFQNFFSDKTIFENILMLKAGHYAYIDLSSNISFSQYWDFNFDEKISISETEAIEEIDRLFKQAVKRQLVSDVPVNAYLSGGIDSGAISMIASQYLPQMKTFTIGFDLSSASGLELSFDERAKAEHISYLAKTEHYEMVLKAGDMERCMSKYVWHLEEPRVGQSYPNFYAAKLASKFGKVVLSGTGGDELFGGYPWRYFYSQDEMSFDKFIDEYYLKWHRLIPNSFLKELLSPIWNEIKHVWTKDIFSNVFNNIRKKNLVSKDYLNFSLYLEAKTFLHGLLIVEDKLSMAHGLESRVPFLDNDLVDFASKLPNGLKVLELKSKFVNENDLNEKFVASHNGKYILRKTLARYLDESIVNTKKQGFSSPDASWFRGESIEYVQNLFNSKSFSDRSLLNMDFVKQKLNDHIEKKENMRLFIWSIMYLINLEKSFNL